MITLKETVKPPTKLWRECKKEIFKMHGVTQKDAPANAWDYAAKKFAEKLEEIGFEFIGSGCFKRAYACEKRNVVVKLYYHYDNKWKDTPSKKPESIKNHIIKNLFRDVMIMIQPLVDNSQDSAWEAEQILEGIYGEKTCHEYDIKESNVGLVDGEPVIFDYTKRKSTWLNKW